jgi:signal transduction histidine kinase
LFALLLVLTGLTLLAISLLLTRRLRDHSLRLQTLLQISAKNLAPLAIASEAWPIMAKAGWQQLVVTGDWFGSPVHTELGATASARAAIKRHQQLLFDINSETDVQLTLHLTHRERQGERWLLAEQLARVLALLIETSLRTRTEALSAALAERARLSLYLQHDMRNMAQWVNWVGTDLGACGSDSELLHLARRLQKNAPLAQERAQRLISALGQRPVDDTPGRVDLAQVVTQAAHLVGLEMEVSGQAQGWIAKSLLARALDNLFANLAPHWRASPQAKPLLHLQMLPATSLAQASAEIQLFSPWPPEAELISPEKLFEPFASGRPGGLGLGLYQARQSLREAGGDLQANLSPGGIRFVLHLPVATP